MREEKSTVSCHVSHSAMKRSLRQHSLGFTELFPLIGSSVSCPVLLRLDICVCVYSIVVCVRDLLMSDPAVSIWSHAAELSDLYPSKLKLLLQAGLHHPVLLHLQLQYQPFL